MPHITGQRSRPIALPSDHPSNQRHSAAVNFYFIFRFPPNNEIPEVLFHSISSGSTELWDGHNVTIAVYRPCWDKLQNFLEWISCLQLQKQM